MKITATAVAAEFVAEGDPHRDNEDDPHRPAGTYLTVRFDDPDVAVVGGKVTVEFIKTETH